MKAVLQEYGRLIIAVLVGGILLMFYYNFVGNEYQNVFPEQNSSHIEQTDSRHLRPVIIVKEQMSIRKGDSDFRMSEGNMDKAYASFQSLAVAYADSERR